MDGVPLFLRTGEVHAVFGGFTALRGRHSPPCALGRQHPVNWPDGQCLPQKAGPCDLPLRTPCDRVHANFPWVTDCRVNAKRLGYDDRQVMRRCIETIDAQRNGANVAELTCIQPIFDNELQN